MPRWTEQVAPPSRKYGALSLFLCATCWSYWNVSYPLVTWISSACISLSQGQHLLSPHLFPAHDTLPLEHCTHKHQVQSLKGAATCQLTRKLATRSTAQCAPSPKTHIHLLQAVLEQQIYVCWKGFTLGSRGDGKGKAGWTWRDCTAQHQERDRHWKKRISPRGNQAQAKEVGMQKI